MGVLSGICSVLAVTVLAGGVAMFNNYQKMHQMESVIASVMPEGSVKQGLLASAGKGSGKTEDSSGKGWSPVDEPDYVIEEAAGKVYPTTAPSAENHKEQSSQVTPETMPPAESSARHEGEGQAGTAGQGGQAGQTGLSAGQAGQAAGQAGQAAGQTGQASSDKTSQDADKASGQGNSQPEGQSKGQADQSSDQSTAPSAAQNSSSPTGEGTTKASKETEPSSKEGATPPATGAREDASSQTVSAVNYSVYTVEEGETLYGICFKLYHDLKHIDEICRVNALTDENSIFAGQKLLVP